jgi:hypothetical protein
MKRFWAWLNAKLISIREARSVLLEIERQIGVASRVRRDLLREIADLDREARAAFASKEAGRTKRRSHG